MPMMDGCVAARPDQLNPQFCGSVVGLSADSNISHGQPPSFPATVSVQFPGKVAPVRTTNRNAIQASLTVSAPLDLEFSMPPDS